MTPYKEIFDLALTKINDGSLANWPEEDLTNELFTWLSSAIAGLPQLKSELTVRDAFDIDDIETKGFDIDLSDTTKEVLALAMVRQWLRPRINSTTTTLQSFARKEGYSQKEFLSGLMALDDKMATELHKLLRDYSYIENDYFD